MGYPGPDGEARMIAQADLADIADDWPRPPAATPGVAEMLAVARALFVHAWWRYEFQLVAVVWSLMAVEAALRDRHAAGDERPSFSELLRRARREGTLGDSELTVLENGRRLRNGLVHPSEQSNMTLGATAPILHTAHLIIDRVARG